MSPTPIALPGARVAVIGGLLSVFAGVAATCKRHSDARVEGRPDPDTGAKGDRHVG